MNSGRVRLWDTQRSQSYVAERDRALERRADEREGTSVARDFDALWPALAEDERAAFQYLILADAKACVGHCNDDLLARLVARGFLIWPPGVRPVLTDDLVTTFLIPPALLGAIEERREAILPPPSLREEARRAAAHRFAAHFTPLTTPGSPDPFAPAPIPPAD